MRAKTSKVRQRPKHKCDKCKKCYANLGALEYHKNTVHYVAAKKISKTALKNITKTTKSKYKIKPKEANVRELIKRPSEANKILKLVKMTKNQKISTGKKIQYECPECHEVYPMYFSAHKHIQKSHCVNSKGEKVLPSAPDLIEPIILDSCSNCNKRYRLTESHVCSDTTPTIPKIESKYHCAGCDVVYNSLRIFGAHLAGKHSDDVEHMFLPTQEDFNKWKTSMEEQTNTKYGAVEKYNMKQFYHCLQLPYTPCESEVTTLLCPSTIITQEFSKGIQVHFHKCHCRHEFEDYVMTDTYKKYLISTFVKNVDLNHSIEAKKEKSDLYKEFKALMDSLVAKAARLDMQNLKLLQNKAIEMNDLLYNFTKDENDSAVVSPPHSALQEAQGNNSPENQISNTPENLSSKKVKGKNSNQNINNSLDQTASTVELQPEEIKKNSKDLKSTKRPITRSGIVQQKTVNKPLSNQQNVTLPVVMPKNNQDETQLRKTSKGKIESSKENMNEINNSKPKHTEVRPTFNDSYKEFVDKQIYVPTTKTENNKIPNFETVTGEDKKKKQNVLKTKIGQFSPNNSPTKKKRSESTADSSSLKKITTELNNKIPSKMIHSTPISSHKKKRVGVNLKLHTNESNLSKNKQLRKKNATNTSSSKSHIKRSKIFPNFSQIKIDRYEVKEQENDCNILILKI